ncbi:DUF1564 family protein [Leptospira ilyithenensis]|uniref:DUF1564 family protein n=1 Tax=Leptospira ilyithenensis TaxID=2484901 RepID=A0A4V3JWN4_9LEPT|nr:DUF1564 family protein [Leptospira ilyithenensis]TGN06959.1 DUF1564 family protein [Leptospira ilyithenensis]
MEKRKIFANDSLELTTLCSIGKSSNTSFLIPVRQMKQLTVSLKLYRSFATRISWLLAESSDLIYFGMIPRKRWKATCSYQEQGLELQKVSCRVFNDSIIEMDIMARSLGISRCRLFVLLLELEAIGWLRLVKELGLIRPTTSFNSRIFSMNYQTISKIQVLKIWKFIPS